MPRKRKKLTAGDQPLAYLRAFSLLCGDFHHFTTIIVPALGANAMRNLGFVALRTRAKVGKG
jgi:hypothetical protein